MKILITGTTGYIARRLIPLLSKQGHSLVCCVRDLGRIPEELINQPLIEFIEIDFLRPNPNVFPIDIDAAYYLIHSMSSNGGNFEELELKCAQNFKALTEKTNCKQVIYLSGIVNDQTLSKHLSSRYQVEKTLNSSKYAVTTLRAGIIVGSGSASFEIIRDIVEKLPIMITPKWLNTKTQPIGIRDVLSFLERALGKRETYNKSYDICGPEVLTYKEMLLQFAEIRGFKRHIFTLPVLTPKLSSYWLYFVTSTSFNLAQALVDSMKIEIIANDSDINEIMGIEPMNYKEAVALAFQKIEQNAVVSSWKDAMTSGVINDRLSDHIQIPRFGCYKDIRSRKIQNEESTISKIWSIGGKNGWYGFNFLWEIRGFIDQIFGGVGLRRGRKNESDVKAGEALDFWRVLYADKKQKRMLLYAEMRLPGEAWLEFKILEDKLFLRAVFRPKGVLGRMYWYSILPFHNFVFKGMLNELTKQ